MLEIDIKADIVLSFYRWEIAVSVSLCNLPEIPELLSGRGKIKTQICQTLKFILSTVSFWCQLMKNSSTGYWIFFQIFIAFDQRIKRMRVSLDPKGSKAWWDGYFLKAHKQRLFWYSLYQILLCLLSATQFHIHQSSIVS